MTLTADVLRVWIAAVEERYLAASTCVMWAEREIQEASPVPPWLLDLWGASDVAAALSSLHAGLRALAPLGHQALSRDLTALRLGMMWLGHERGDVSLEQLLARAGALADAANLDAPSCEAIYAILNDVEAGAPSSADSPSAARALRLFAPHAALAREGLQEILGAGSLTERAP